MRLSQHAQIIEAYEKYGFAYPSGADMLGAEAARE